MLAYRCVEDEQWSEVKEETMMQGCLKFAAAVIFAMIAALALTFLLALPFAWCWNSAIAPTMRVGELTWLQSWCLLLAVRFLAPIGQRVVTSEKE